MASPASPPPNAEPAPALLSAHTPRVIRDALIDAERTEFERRYAEEMAAAARTLDLTGVLTVLNTYRKIADITQRQGVEEGVPPAGSPKDGTLFDQRFSARTLVIEADFELSSSD